MSRWLTLFLLICCYFVTCSKARNPCREFHGASSDVCGLIGENISLTCNVPRNCTRGYWRYDYIINLTWLMPEQYSGDTYDFDFNSSQGVNTLHIDNINDNVAGFYVCFCENDKGTRTTHACFNLSVQQCPISVEINGEKHVFESCSTRSEVEMVDVEVNGNITIKCNEESKRRTNCSHIGEQISFTVSQSHHLCCFKCRPKNGGVKCKVNSVVLNVINKVILTSTARFHTEIFPTITERSLTWPFFEMTSNQPSFLDTPVTIKPKPNATRDHLTTLLPSKIIIPSSLILLVCITLSSTCAFVLFYKREVCRKSSREYNTQSDGGAYHDIVEMQSPSTNPFYSRHIDHRTDSEDNEVVLSESNDITNNSASFQFYDEPNAYIPVNKVEPKVSMDRTVGNGVYNNVQKTSVEMESTISHSPNTGGDMDTYTGVADMETHFRDDTESNTYTFVDRNAL